MDKNKRKNPSEQILITNQEIRDLISTILKREKDKTTNEFDSRINIFANKFEEMFKKIEIISHEIYSTNGNQSILERLREVEKNNKQFEKSSEEIKIHFNNCENIRNEREIKEAKEILDKVWASTDSYDRKIIISDELFRELRSFYNLI